MVSQSGQDINAPCCRIYEHHNMIEFLPAASLDVLQCVDMSCMDIIKGVCGKVNGFMNPIPPFMKRSKKLNIKKRTALKLAQNLEI